MADVRLIDANELRIRIIAFATGCHSEVLTVDTLMMLLIQAPTINPEDCRAQGYWIECEDAMGDTYYDCSVCGESFSLIDGNPTDNLYNYCPNCGAKMDGEEQGNG